MGRMLFEEQTDVETLIGEYFEAAYGKNAKDAKTYLEALSALKCCDYLNGKGERVDAQMAERMRRIEEICEAFEPEQFFPGIDTEDGTRESCGGSRSDGNGQPARLFWKLLAFHKEYILRLAGAMELLARAGGRRRGKSGVSCAGTSAVWRTNFSLIWMSIVFWRLHKNIQVFSNIGLGGRTR